MLDRLRKRLYQAVQAANPKELIVRKAKISVAINMHRMLVGCFRHYSLPRVWTNMAMGRHGKDTKLRDQILKSEARQQVNNAVGNSLKLNALGVNGGLIRFAPIDSAAIEISHGWYGSSYPWGTYRGGSAKMPEGLISPFGMPMNFAVCVMQHREGAVCGSRSSCSRGSRTRTIP